MLGLGAILLLASAASAAFTAPTLRGVFSMTGTPDVDSFFKIPRTAAEAEAMGWVQPPETVGSFARRMINAVKRRIPGDGGLRTFCEVDDPRICILVDDKGSIAGYQISFPTTVQVPDIDYVEKGFTEQTMFGKRMLSNKIFFVEQDVIKSGGRSFDGQTGTGLWLQAGKELTTVPIHESGMNQTKFTKQNCFPRMGQHWFWAITKQMTKDEYMPWFTLFDAENNLIGFGFIAFGAKYGASPEGLRPWFEKVPLPAIYGIAPAIPDWIAEYVTKYEVISHHVYFTDEPWNIKCTTPPTMKSY